MELPRHEMALSDSVGSRRTTPDWEQGFEPGARADEADVSQVSADDDGDFSQEIAPRRSKGAEPAPLTSGLTTAAELLARQSQPRVSPNAFRNGMTVEHPQYGAGTIIALSGDGPKRTATVRFMKDDAERKFRLIFSDLVPVTAQETSP
jgi:DNA helicase-2/ATP-dependent DNA helicase PcrA